MLAGQQSGGHDNRHLKTGNRHGKSSPQGDFGFTKADIATDQTIHRMTRGQIIQHRINGALLVFCFIIQEARTKFVVKPFGRDMFGGFVQGTRRGNLDEGMRHFADALLHLGFAGLPCAAA